MQFCLTKAYKAEEKNYVISDIKYNENNNNDKNI